MCLSSRRRLRYGNPHVQVALAMPEVPMSKKGVHRSWRHNGLVVRRQLPRRHGPVSYLRPFVVGWQRGYMTVYSNRTVTVGC